MHLIRHNLVKCLIAIVWTEYLKNSCEIVVANYYYSLAHKKACKPISYMSDEFFSSRVVRVKGRGRPKVDIRVLPFLAVLASQHLKLQRRKNFLVLS